MTTCTLDYRHTPVWCEPCWESQERTRQTQALSDIAAMLAQLLPEDVERAVAAPPPPRPRPAPMPRKSEPPSMTYQWRS